jgi:hypothetical protein
LAGINDRVQEQLAETDLLELIGAENVFLSGPRFGAAVEQALTAAEEWLVQGQGNKE